MQLPTIRVKVKSELAARGLKQAEVAAQMGLAAPAFSKLIASDLSADDIERLAEAIGAAKEELVAGTSEAADAFFERDVTRQAASHVAALNEAMVNLLGDKAMAEVRLETLEAFERAAKLDLGRLTQEKADLQSQLEQESANKLAAKRRAALLEATLKRVQQDLESRASMAKGITAVAVIGLIAAALASEG